MDISSTKVSDSLILSLAGRMDATTTSDFDTAADTALNEGNHKILVDMADLVYVSSAGLRSFLTLAKKCKTQQGKLCFCCLQPMVAEVFRISGFDRMLAVFPEQEAALTSLKG